MIDDDAFRIWIWIWIRGRVPWMNGMRARFRRPRCGRHAVVDDDDKNVMMCGKHLLAPHVDSRIFGAAIARVRRSTRTGGDVIDASRTMCSEKRIDDEFL